MNPARLLFAFFFAAFLCPFVQADESVDLTGVWHAEAGADGNSRKVTWTFTKDGEKFKGTSFDHETEEERELDRIKVKGKNVTLEIDVEQDGIEGMIVVEVKETAPGKLEGEFEVVGDDGTEYLSGDVTAAKEVTFAGVWNTVAVLPGGQELESQLKLEGANAKLMGSLVSENGEIKIETIRAKKESLHFEFEFDMDGNTLDVEVKADAKGKDKLVGKWSASGEEGDWSAVRKPTLVGLWNVVATIPDSADYKGTLMLKKKAGKYSGVSKRDNGDTQDLSKIKIDDQTVMFSTPFEQDGFEGIVTVTAKLRDDGSLDGDWVMVSDGQEVASDSWKATKSK